MNTTQKASIWSVTINNPTADDEEEIVIARQKGWKVDGQQEVGKEGTPHYQLIVHTGQVRFSAVKKQFSRAHIEVCRNPAALQQYVHKEDTRTGQLKTDSQYYPSLSKTWNLWYAFVKEEYGEFWMAHFDRQTSLVEKSWNQFVCSAIESGFHIEGIAVNPSTISCVRKFGKQILSRSADECIQQASQTDESNSVKEENVSVE